MDYLMKVVVNQKQWGINYDGYGKQDRKYSIHRHKESFIASLISGEGQYITAIGRSPLEALQRAESVQPDKGR